MAARDQLTRQCHVEGRQGHLAVRQHIDLVTADAEHDHRAEFVIARDACAQLQRVFATLHRLQAELMNARALVVTAAALGIALRHLLGDAADRQRDILRTGKVLHHAGRQPLWVAAIAERLAVVFMHHAQRIGALTRRLVVIRGRTLQLDDGARAFGGVEHIATGRGRDAVGIEHLRRFRVGQPFTAGTPRAVHQIMGAGADLGAGREGQARRRLLQQCLHTVVIDHLQEGLDALLRRQIGRNAGQMAFMAGRKCLLEPHPAGQQVASELLAMRHQGLGRCP